MKLSKIVLKVLKLSQNCQITRTFSFHIIRFGYALVWFGMIPHHLVWVHFPDMLPYKIWKNCPSYANFSIIWYGIGLYGYVFVNHHLMCAHCPDMLPC